MSSSLTISGFTLTHQALHATQETGISPIERLVLGTLAGFCNFLSECWPSNQTLADRTGLHERTVRRQLESLQAKGLIERHSRGQGRAMLTRVLITPQGRTPDTVPPTPDTVPPYEPTRNLLQTPIAVDEPATPEPSTETATAVVVFTENEQPITPQAITKEMRDVFATDSMVPVSEVTGCHPQAGMPVEARTAPQEPSKEVPATDPLADVPAQAVAALAEGTDSEHQAEVPATQDQATSEADPLAEVPAQLLADFGEVRRNKKKAAKVTKTEAQVLAQEAAKAGLSVKDLILLCVLRGWSYAKAEWITNLPAHVQPGTPSASPQIWKPEIVKVASPEVVAAMKEKIAAMKARWKVEALNAPPPKRRYKNLSTT